MARILVIEDESTIALVLQKLLSRAGHDVTIALDGFAGWEELQTGSAADLVILDLFLPGLSGRRLIELIRSHKLLKGLPVIVITGAVRGEEFPPRGSYQALFEKPFDPIRLVEEAQGLLSGEKLRSSP